jgi:ribosomal protein S18 acetylase RimI-like enzyme
VTVVVRVTAATNELVEGLNRLLPQLSSSASPLALADLEAMVASPAVTLLVARDGETITGTLTLIVFPIPTGQRAWIEDVVVDDGARGHGIGRALTEAALDVAREHGARTIDLTSRPSREGANAMYLNLGFEQRATNVYRFFLESQEPEK